MADKKSAEDHQVEAVEEERGHWGKGIEFFLSCVGYAVGSKFQFQFHF